MADETMFERLQRALANGLMDESFANVGIYPGGCCKLPDTGSDIVEFDGAISTAAIVRALLTELRTMAVELPDGFVTVASFTDAPKVTIAATEQTVVKAGAVGFIDAILAEAKP